MIRYGPTRIRCTLPPSFLTPIGLGLSASASIAALTRLYRSSGTLSSYRSTRLLAVLTSYTAACPSFGVVLAERSAFPCLVFRFGQGSITQVFDIFE